MEESTSRWATTGGPRGSDYDNAWSRLVEEGKDPHGEVAFVMRFEPERVLDAGCGTGRVAIELVNRGVEAVGFDLDEDMLSEAESKAPEVRWLQADAATVELPHELFDVVVLAGNVMIFVEAGSEGAVVANLARCVAENGRLVAGFKLLAGRYGLEAFDEHTRAAGLVLVERWSTWACDPWNPGDDYAVSVFQIG